ncbi:MAG: M20/M25/M40 family metallo-hydrolase [Bacteroidales bacterium]|nr:M20/M25/M40 family metallo-hydrolase [Bacteroidales bacterium]
MNCDFYMDLLRKMVAISSQSGNEAEVAVLISAALDELGIKHELLRNNIVAVNEGFDKSKPTLALDAHIDTVAPNNGYTRDPYDAGNDPEKVWGLGSNDDGGSVVSMIAAFKHFYKEEMPINLMLVLTAEEETSGPDGADWLYSPAGPFAEGKKYQMPKWVIVGEPTKMQAATSERGLLVLDGMAEGVSAHAARGGGDNALYKALEDISTLRAHEFGRISPKMGKVHLNVTQISAGSAHNVIPDRCSFVVDIRPTEQYGCEEILEELQAICKSKLSARNLSHRSSATAEGSPLLKTVEALGIPTFTSPTTSNWMVISCDALKMGPGDSERSHRADEYLLRSELEGAVATYIDFISTLYGNSLE